MLKLLRVLFAGPQSPQTTQLYSSLEQAGWELDKQICASCEEAYASLESYLPQLVFVYWHSLGPLAKSCLRDMVQQQPDLPFIAVFDKADSMGISEALQTGAWDFVCPESIQQIKSKVEACLNKSLSVKKRILDASSLRISEQYYRQMVHASHEGICYVKPDGRISYCNPCFSGLFLLESQSLVGANIQELIFEDYQDEFKKLLEVRSAGESLQDEIRMKSNLKDELWCCVTSLPIYDDDEVFDGILLEVSDRTEVRLIEIQQRKLHDRLMTHLNSTPLGFIEWDEQIRVSLWSDRMERFLGWKSDELIGKTPWTWPLLHEADAPAFRNSVQELLDGATSSQSVSLRIFDKSGAMHHVEFYSSGHRDVLTGKSSILTQVLDVTDQIVAQKTLRESEERFDLAVRGAGLGVWDWWLPEDRIVFNRRAGRMMGLPSNLSECDAFTWTSNMVLSDQSRACKVIKKHLNGDSSHFENEYRILDENGGHRWILDRARVVERCSNGTALRVSGTQLDITERKRVEIELKAAKAASDQANKAKSTFLAHMSHDIRTPLNSILGFADILEHEDLSADNSEIVDLIKKSGQRLLHTLNSVLDLAQLESRQVRMKIMSIDMGDLASDIVEMMGNTARNKGLTLNLEVLDDGPIYAAADEVALHRVLSNLVNNAIAYTESGSVSVSVLRDGEESVLRVQDTGRGIEAHLLPNIFDSMKMDERQLLNRHEGTGLGLTICKGLVGLMHGDISVESEVGKGSVFTVRLPREIGKKNGVASSIGSIPVYKSQEIGNTVPPMPNSSSRKSILVVDDDEITRKMYHALEGDYDVSIVPGFDEALAVARSAYYDVLFLDINLGETRTGKDLLVMLRDIPGYEDTPVVACTAFALPGDKEHLIDSGFKMYLSKPFSYKRLKDTLEELLSLETADL